MAGAAGAHPGGFPPPGAPGPHGGGFPPPGGQGRHAGGHRPPPRRGGGGSKGPLIAVVAVAAVVLLAAGAAGIWFFLQSRQPEPPASSTGERRRTVTSPSPSAKPVKLRPVTGDQLCSAVPDALRKSLVTDGRYGGRQASTPAATETEKRAACAWHNSKMDVGGGVLGHRSLTIAVAARSPDGGSALDHAKDRFEADRKGHERRVNVRDGKRTDGRTSGSAFGELKELDHGDASYSQSSIGHSGLKAAVFVRQGPWLIQVEYGGSNRTGAKYPSGDEVRAAAGKVAERVTAEMAKAAGKVKLDGPCAILTAANVESALFRTAEGPSVGGSDGRIKHTTCTWRISEEVAHEPGQEFTARGGELRVHLVDWGGGDSGAKFQFDREAAKFDRYRAKGGIGDTTTHTDYEPRRQLSGLGGQAFVVLSSATRPDKPDDKPMREILVKVLIGDRTVDFTFRGTTAGGGVVGADGYQEPVLDPAAAERALTKLARTFVTGLK
ncbi:hypothetical protein [Nonomuraea sp. KM90]|uniref:hypothetical protein n=1 Tax=Nonomuraea sp. KM90 TaxID=3457428 RepID=UPI003FCD3E49